MIDFRYHLVSIVSIFLALAVGIVLGAGPLKGEIGSTLTKQVEQLRDQKAALDTKVKEGETAAKAHTAFEEAIVPSAVAERLATHRVALVVLPDTETAVVDAARDALTAAGSAPTAVVTLTSDFVDPAAQAARDKALQGVTKDLALTAAELEAAQPLTAALGVAIAHGTAPAKITVERARRGLDALAAADLLSVDYGDFQVADSVVVASGVLSDKDPEALTAAVERYAALTGALDGHSLGAVTVGAVDPEVVATDRLSVVEGVRRSDASRGVSTVDDVTTAMGRASLVFGLLQQIAGGTGHYGGLDSATAAFAPVPAS